jgi:hypothetical protein
MWCEMDRTKRRALVNAEMNLKVEKRTGNVD